MNEIILEFTGHTDGAQVFRHPETRRSIRAGRSLGVRYAKVTPDEVTYFLSLGVFRIVHNNVPPVNVARRESPKKIEPIVPISETIENVVTEKETPTENVVSFDVSLEEIETDIGWLQQKPEVVEEVVEEVAEEVVEQNVEEVAAEEIEEPAPVSESNTNFSAVDKIRRGRPRN